MVMDSTEAHAMLEAARRRSDLVAMVAPSPFTLSVDAAIERLISQGYLGDLVSVDVRDLASDFPDPTVPLHRREELREGPVDVHRPRGIDFFFRSGFRNSLVELLEITVLVDRKPDPLVGPR